MKVQFLANKENDENCEDNAFESLKDINDLKNIQIQQQNNIQDSDEYGEEQEYQEQPQNVFMKNSQPYYSERDQYENNENFSDNGIKFIDAQGSNHLQYDDEDYEEEEFSQPKNDQVYFNDEEELDQHRHYPDQYQSQGENEEGESNEQRALQESDEDEEILRNINAHK